MLLKESVSGKCKPINFRQPALLLSTCTKLYKEIEIKLYILKRLFILVLLLFGISLLTFSLTQALPGDPVENLAGERVQPEAIEKIRRELGMDKGIFIQYMNYMKRLMQGEMGRSYYTNRKVLEDIIIKFPNTIKLALGAMLIAVPIGIFLGFLAAHKRDTYIDRTISSVSILGLSLPVFWSGLIIMLFLSLRFRLFPPSGTGDIRYLVMPALTLSLPAIASLTRITRASIIEIADMPFINTARAKGLSTFRINAVHIFRNVLIPLVTVIGLDIASYLNGAVLTETIFGWDGIGRFTMDGIMKRDYPVIMGCIIIGTLVFVIINLVVDILYHYLDPRVRLYAPDR